MATLDQPELRESLNTLLKSTRPRLERVLRSFEVPPEDAEDILQDAQLTLLYKWDKIRSPENWLVGTVKKKCIMYWRKRRGSLCHPRPHLHAPGTAAGEGRARLRPGSSALGSLDPVPLTAAAAIRPGVWTQRGRRADGLPLVEHSQGHQSLPGGADASAAGRGLRAQILRAKGLSCPRINAGGRLVRGVRHTRARSCYQAVVVPP
jgi:hypothetical protein